MRNSNKKILVVLFILIGLFIMFETKIGVYAYDEYIEYGINDNELYNKTNTFNYDKIEDANGYITQYYDMNSDDENNELVSADAPIMTVITHGLGGSASHWSNNGENGEFTYKEDSIISRLAKVCDSYVYWLKMTSSSTYDLISLMNKQVKLKMVQD